MNIWVSNRDADYYDVTVMKHEKHGYFYTTQSWEEQRKRVHEDITG